MPSKGKGSDGKCENNGWMHVIRHGGKERKFVIKTSEESTTHVHMLDHREDSEEKVCDSCECIMKSHRKQRSNKCETGVCMVGDRFHMSEGTAKKHAPVNLMNNWKTKKAAQVLSEEMHEHVMKSTTTTFLS